MKGIHPKLQRRILITGGSGYVGTALVPLLACRYPVTVYCNFAFGNAIKDTPGVRFIKGDMRDGVGLRKALAGVTDIVHLAGIVTDELVDLNPKLAADINERGTETLCKAARECGVMRIVYASSSSVYGTQDIVCTEETPPKPMTAYAAMKLAGEHIINANAGDMTVCHVRSATCCGPAPRMRLDTIVNVFSAQAHFDGVIRVHGGSQHRSNIHVLDIAELYAWLVDRAHGEVHGRVFNAVREFATAQAIARCVQSTVEERTGKRPEVDIDVTKQDNRHYRMAAPALAALGWAARRTIADAVADNLRWFQAGNVKDWKSDLYYNTLRLAKTMKEGKYV